MDRRLPITLLSAIVWAHSVSAMAVAEPQITAPAVLPRQQQDNFIGWVEASGTWYSETCDPGLTWYQDGVYAQCCPTTLASCYAPTACVDGTLIYTYPEVSTTLAIACTDNFQDPSHSICNTAFIYENFDDSSPQTDIVCGASSVNWSYYRKIPASATEPVSTNAASTTEDARTTGLSTRASPATTSTSTSTSTSSPTPTSAAQPKKKSNVWIAGAVAGPIVGLAIIGGVIAFLLYRRKQKNVAVTNQPSTTGYTETKPGFGTPQVHSHPPTPGYNGYYGQDPYGEQPLSPVPQYQAPYSPPASPPPGGFTPDQKHVYQHIAHPEAAELGGPSSSAQRATSTTHTAELGGESSSAQPLSSSSYTAELSGEVPRN